MLVCVYMYMVPAQKGVTAHLLLDGVTAGLLLDGVTVRPLVVGVTVCLLVDCVTVRLLLDSVIVHPLLDGVTVRLLLNGVIVTIKVTLKPSPTHVLLDLDSVSFCCIPSFTVAAVGSGPTKLCV